MYTCLTSDSSHLHSHPWTFDLLWDLAAALAHPRSVAAGDSKRLQAPLLDLPAAAAAPAAWRALAPRHLGSRCESTCCTNFHAHLTKGHTGQSHMGWLSAQSHLPQSTRTLVRAKAADIGSSWLRGRPLRAAESAGAAERGFMYHKRAWRRKRLWRGFREGQALLCAYYED